MLLINILNLYQIGIMNNTIQGQYTLLILDEWLLVKLTETEARDLLEIIHARHHKASTIFCSQFAPMGWYNKFPEGQIASHFRYF